jgi:nitrate reductase gamma subunit
MSFLTGFFAVFFYVATFIFIAFTGYKIVQYVRTPAPLKIPAMPAPLTQGGVVVRLIKEVVLFYSLFRSNKWIWLFGWVFHFSLFLVLLRHFRYFLDLSNPIWFWVPLIQPFGKYASFTMIIGLTGLLIRRIYVERHKYISSPSDYLHLILLLFIAFSGCMMTFVVHTDIVQLKAFIQGAITFGLTSTGWQPIPASPILFLHLTAVFLLMIVFPFSKLLHAPGVFFSPTRNQVDNAREKRHIAPWAAKLDATRQP